MLSMQRGDGEFRRQIQLRKKKDKDAVELVNEKQADALAFR